jgi:hypothetical protein
VPVTESHVHAVLEQYFAGMNAERYTDVAALFAQDAYLWAPGIEPVIGRKAVEGYYRAALAPYPQHKDESTRIIVAAEASVATVEIHFTGALASGIPLEFDAVDVFDFGADGLVARMTSWYDSHGVRKMLRQAREAAAAQ